MDVAELMRIVRSEGLETPILYGDAPLRNDAVVLEHAGAEWKVFLANERGGLHASTVRLFDSESDALEQVLLKARQSRKAKRSLESLERRQARS